MSNQQPQQIQLSPEDNKLAQQLLEAYKGKIIKMLSDMQQFSTNSFDELINDRVVLGAQIRQLQQENQSLKAVNENLTTELTTLKNQGSPKIIPPPLTPGEIEPTSKN